MIVRILLGIAFLLGYASQTKAQVITEETSSKSTEWKLPIRSGFSLGWEVTGAVEEYPGFRISTNYFFTPKNYVDLSGMYVYELRPEIRGFSSSLLYKRLLAKNVVFVGGGVRYSDSDMDTDVILRRFGGAFFEEIEVTQRRTLLAGILSAGLLLPVTKGVNFNMEYQFIYGKEVKSKIQNTPLSSEFEPNQDVDSRIAYVIQNDLESTLRYINLNLAIMFDL